ncbi:hypothetical protein Tco_0707748 [Tanacetum coccineum]
MKDSEAYKQYYAVASGAEPPKAKTKYKKKADKPVTRSKSKTAPASKGSGLKSPAKVTKSGNKKIPAQGLETLSETSLSEVEQMKVVTKRSKIDYHISHASGSGANEGIGVTPGVPYGTEDEQISWKSSGKSKEGSKSHQQSTGKSAQAEEPIHTTTPIPDWFQKPSKPPTPDRDCNKTLPAIHGPIQPWFSTLSQNKDPRESFNELMDTPLDFSAFVLNRLKVDTLTPELLTAHTTYTLDWNNPEGHQYPHDLRKPLPLIPNSRGRRVIPFDHFINNDLEYLSGGVSSRTYPTSVTKIKAADYGHIKWIEDLVPNTMWRQVPIVYDKHALWGISHWGRKHQQLYGYAVNRESARDITIHRDDNKVYTFKEGDYNRLRLQDIKDMLLLLVQGKLTNLNIEERLALGVSLRMFTRSIVIKRRVKDLQLGVEIYQKKLNLTKPDTYRSDLKRKTPYTAYSNPRGFIYQNQGMKNKLMRIDEVHTFSDDTLNDVRSALDDTLKKIRMKYLPQTI